MRRRRLVMMLAVVAILMGVMAPASAADPTCSGTFGGALGVVHGQHVFSDYATGDVVVWPPAGQANAAGGAAVPGGPGPGFHFPNGFAPGASFCLLQSQSPGTHPGPS